MTQLTLTWCLKYLHVGSIITGASKPQQVEENMKTMEVVEKLTPGVMERVEEILDNKPEPGPDFSSLSP